MLTNFWRFSHFLLALLSSVFLIIAAVTGIVLSTEPVADFANSSADTKANDTITLASFIPHLQEEYLEVFSIEVEKYGAVRVDVIGMDEEADGEFYIQPASAAKVADIQSQNAVYAWTTALHRSLFLKQTGRYLMGISVFLLLLMTISGMALVFKQTQGFKKLFSKIKRQNTSQYNHTVLGRIFFLFIFLMSLGGALMFLNTQFHFQANETQYFPIQNKSALTVEEFPVFQELTLSEIKRLDFPFSPEEEDYFILELPDKTFEIHQYSGEIVSQQDVSSLQKAYGWAEVLHTGRGNIIWAIILGLISLNILYFIYSGARISWKRISSKTGNKFKVNDAEVIILVGTENGSTRNFGSLLYKALLKARYKVYIDNMNQYQYYENAKYLIILAATYGDGEAPYNAQYFLRKAKSVKQKNVLQTFIIGFGSMSYPNFCKYPVDVYSALKGNPNFKVLGVPPLIHNQSFTSFQSAMESLKNCCRLDFEVPVEESKKLPSVEFKVVKKEVVEDGYTETFTLELKALKKAQYQSGDLLAITPPTESMARYYSIGKLSNGNIILSIKKHELGICSNYLYKCQEGDNLSARIKLNPTFYFPKKGTVLLVGNGTGIAPFVGMMPQNAQQEVHYLFGGRNEESFAIYQEPLINKISSPENIQFAYSKCECKEKYVQDLIIKNQDLLFEVLKNKGTVMICGSVKMRDGVLQEIKSIITRERVGLLENFVERKQILMDCY